MRVLVAVILLALPIAGLVGWVMVRNQPVVFAVPMDHGRALPQGDFYVSAVEEPRDLNPLTSRDAWALSFVIRFTHDCLLRLDSATGELQSGVVELEGSSADQLEFSFRLRDGVQFADGSPVSLDDIAFPFEVSQQQDFALGSIADAVRRVARFERIDDRRCKFVLKERHFTGLKGFATEYRVVKKQWFVERVAELAAAAGRPVPEGLGDPGFGELLARVELSGPGTGPYQLAVDQAGKIVWDHGKELWLVQNPRSWHRSANPRAWNLAGMRLRFISGQQAKYTELRNGRLDWYMPMDIDALVEKDPEILQTYRRFDYDTPANGQFFCLWNHRRPYLADARVRRALTMLFDRERIKAELFGGNARVARCWFKYGSPDYSPDLPPIPFDPVAARALLADAGFGVGGAHGPLEITIIGAHEERFRRILKLAQSAFLNAGVRLHAQLMENTAAKKRRDAGDFDGCMLYWRHSVTGVDPHEFFHSNPQGNDAGSNLMGYRNQAVDDLLERARVEPDDTERRAMYHRFNRLVHDDQPITLFVHPRSSLLLHRRFQAAEPRWSGVSPEFFWVAPADRLYRRGLPK